MGARQDSLNRKFNMLAAGTMALGSVTMGLSGTPSSSWAAASLAVVARPFAPLPGQASGHPFSAMGAPRAELAVPTAPALIVGSENRDVAQRSYARSAELGSPIVSAADVELPPLTDASQTTAAGAPDAAPVLLAQQHTVRVWTEPGVGAETRPSSPMPVAGDILGPQPEAIPVQPPQEAVVQREAPPAPPREVHVLTSFDGTRTMTSGDAPPQVWNPPAPQVQQRPWPPAPATWNNPIHWLSTHKNW